jgi:hypothetical protein
MMTVPLKSTSNPCLLCDLSKPAHYLCASDFVLMQEAALTTSDCGHLEELQGHF